MKTYDYSNKWKDIWKLPLDKNNHYDYIYSSNKVLALSSFRDDWACDAEIIDKIVGIINGEINSDFLPEWQAKGCDILYQGEYAFCVRGWGYLIGTGGLNLSVDAAKETQNRFISYILSRLNGKTIEE